MVIEHRDGIPKRSARCKKIHRMITKRCPREDIRTKLKLADEIEEYLQSIWKP